MSSDHAARNFPEFINKQQWATLIKRFIDVLKINIFVFSSKGEPLIIPSRDRYGWTLLSKSSLKDKLFSKHSIQLQNFHKHGAYLEYHCDLDLHNFAIPVYIEKDNPLAYLFVGPVLLNKRKQKSEYELAAEKMKMNPKDLTDALGEVRLTSFVDMKSLLDLLNEVFHYAVQWDFQKQTLVQKRQKIDMYPLEVLKAARDIHRSHLNEILENLLEVALQITQAEAGSIMTIDELDSGNLTVRFSRGMKQDIQQKTRSKIGEGIAGTAVKENSSFIIHGTETSDNRIRPYLRRNDIRHAIVAPLESNKKVFGVLNLHTKNPDCLLSEKDLSTIQMLSKLTSVPFSEI